MTASAAKTESKTNLDSIVYVMIGQVSWWSRKRMEVGWSGVNQMLCDRGGHEFQNIDL